MKKVLFAITILLCIDCSVHAQGIEYSSTTCSDTSSQIKSGEVFYTTISTLGWWELQKNGLWEFSYAPEIVAVDTNFNAITFKTKRLGTTLCDNKGKLIQDQLPVFVQKSELLERK